MSADALIEEFEVTYRASLVALLSTRDARSWKPYTRQNSLVGAFCALGNYDQTYVQEISESVIEIDVEPEEDMESVELIKLKLQVAYGPDYPDVLPQLSLHPLDDGGEIDDEEIAMLLKDLYSVGEENLGIAMTFTLVSHLRERLAAFVKERAERIRKEEMEKERLAIEAEEARTRGTAVTHESFKAWKIKFDQEQAAAKRANDEEKLRGLTAKEREESRRAATRLSGRQLFEGNRNLEEDSLMEEGTVSVDVSQYDRSNRDDEPEEEEGITFSDSD
ncbi:RWD-domain-containing protein [Mycena indigotica]|uniref:RWD-domain-containing protein n=1 Tax=Mycena indigotica TaxID=2126181 RepID=A0A8H6W0J9_9AGAR|nr:RWD-domain-containing protein [Mycena indigotica]KAF7294954.1 RWD-domain-containing protein [Mycena indigotica]